MWKKWKIWTRDIKKSMLRAFARSRAKNQSSSRTISQYKGKNRLKYCLFSQTSQSMMTCKSYNWDKRNVKD